jgi:hypothetical protein
VSKKSYTLISYCLQGCHTGRLEANGWAGGLAHYARRELGILYIFSEYSLKIPRIYLNMLGYTRIYLNISLLGGHGGLLGEVGGRAGRRTNNRDYLRDHNVQS